METQTNKDLPQDLKRRFEQEALPLLDQLYAAAWQLVGNSQDAQDLVQETMLKGFAAFHSYTPNTNIKAWLYRILHNVFISNYQKAKRRPRVVSDLEMLDRQEYQGEKRGDFLLASTEMQVLEKIPDVQVQEALRQLSVERRTAVYLADVAGFSYQEIAEVMGTPVGTVMSRINRGRKQLRQLLAEYAREHGYLGRGE